MSDFEREIELELRRVLDPVTGMSEIPPRRPPVRRGVLRKVLGGAGAALSVKLLSGVAVAAAAVTVAGAATTGSINPVAWGQQVKQHVEDCKAELADGQHGIGDCVSAFASQHGQKVASEARHHGNGNGNNESGPANSHGNNPKASDRASEKKTRSGSPKGMRTGSTEPESSDPAVRATPNIPPQQ